MTGQANGWREQLKRRLGFSRESLPYPEVLDDGLFVRALMERLRNARAQDKKPDPTAIAALDIADEMLAQAERTTILEEKWSCINKANAILVYACKTREEQLACMLRLKNLFPLLARFKDRLPDPFRSFSPEAADVKEFNPRRAFEVLATAAQGWHLVNEQNAFSTRFWNLARLMVVLLLIVAVGATEMANWVAPSPLNVSIKSSLEFITGRVYFWSVVFGGFGGALSMLLNSRRAYVSATTFRVAISQGYVRILLGGVGAFVVVLAIESGFVFNEALVQLIDNFETLAIISIAAGFSERLFLSTLERVAGTLESQASARDSTERPAATNGRAIQAIAGAEDDYSALVDLARTGDLEDVDLQEPDGFGELVALAESDDNDDAKTQDSAQLDALARHVAAADNEDAADQDPA